jgi:hypothetical protein
MARHRVALLFVAALFTAGMNSAASAGWGVRAPVVYSQWGCGHCGVHWGCDRCGAPAAAAVYAEPVAVTAWPVGWRNTCGCPCGCRGLFGAFGAAIAVTPIAPAPIYVVNQGPDFTGPGIVVPYRTWTPPLAYYGPRYGYAYRHRYRGYGYAWHRHFYARRHVVYRTHAHPHPRYYKAGANWRFHPSGMH